MSQQRHANHLSHNKVFGEPWFKIQVKHKRDCSVLVFWWPQREGEIRMKFERNFTENSNQDHVELRIKENESALQNLGGFICLYVFFWNSFIQHKYITILNPRCLAFLALALLCARNPGVGDWSSVSCGFSELLLWLLKTRAVLCLRCHFQVLTSVK